MSNCDSKNAIDYRAHICYHRTVERSDGMVNTWEDYKNKVRESDDEQSKQDLQEMEELAALMTIIIKRRQALGLSQRELAKRCGMPQSSIARMETGITFPRIDTLAKVLRVLGLSLVVQPAG